MQVLIPVHLAKKYTSAGVRKRERVARGFNSSAPVHSTILGAIRIGTVRSAGRISNLIHSTPRVKKSRFLNALRFVRNDSLHGQRCSAARPNSGFGLLEAGVAAQGRAEEKVMKVALETVLAKQS